MLLHKNDAIERAMCLKRSSQLANLICAPPELPFRKPGIRIDHLRQLRTTAVDHANDFLNVASMCSNETGHSGRGVFDVTAREIDL
jgi:hypothetical protein